MSRRGRKAGEAFPFRFTGRGNHSPPGPAIGRPDDRLRANGGKGKQPAVRLQPRAIRRAGVNVN